MGKLKVGFIGTGKKPDKPGVQGYGMAHRHAAAFRALKERIEIVAVADIKKENADAFCELFEVPRSAIYIDYHDMLKREKLDVVSICTWPRLHAPMAIAAAEAKVRGIYCEKPMADSWGAARRMHEAAEANGVKLAFNHQRRYARPFRTARKLIDEGAVGALERIEFACADLYDWGTHCFDLANYLNGERRAVWVLAQIDYREENLVFGQPCENQGVAQWAWENGVAGLAFSGQGRAALPALMRAQGSEGVLEIGPMSPGEHPQPLRVRRFGAKAWDYVDCEGDGLHGSALIDRAIADFVACLLEGRACELESANALKASEVIFALYESSRQRGRVDLPLDIDDHPLAAMVESGALKPVPKAGV